MSQSNERPKQLLATAKLAAATIALKNSPLATRRGFI